MRRFKTLANRTPIELISYIDEYRKSHPDLELLIGCDSQNRKKETYYAIVIGLYTPKKGAHVLYSKFEVPREKDNVTRLINEVWFSVEVAEQIRTELDVRAKYIDIDINADVKYKSNQALGAALGLARGMGYDVRHKNSSDGNFPMITYMCDTLVKQ